MNSCLSCGSDNAEDVRYCVKCGKRLEPPAPRTPAPAAAQTTQSSSTLARAGLSVAVVVACIALLGLVPCLGWLNWFALIFGKIALVLCIVALVSEKDPTKRGPAMAGLIITSGALGVAVIRLIVSLAFGGGCL